MEQNKRPAFLKTKQKKRSEPVLEDIPVSANIEGAIATATEQLDQLIPLEGRKTGRSKTLVRIGKPYQQIIQLALEAQTDSAMGVSARSRRGCRRAGGSSVSCGGPW